jgi:electron transport complex protein RnfG
MIKTLKLGGYLLLVCAVAGLALAGTNQWTFGIIATQRLEAERALLGRVLPGAVSFEGEGDVRQGRDADGRWAGVILKVVAVGYSGPIEAFIGLDKNRRVTGFEILKQTETPGLGTKIALPAFTRQFLGKALEELNLTRSGGAIEGITAATISSRAITNAARDRIEEYLASDAATRASDAAPESELETDVTETTAPGGAR